MGESINTGRQIGMLGIAQKLDSNVNVVTTNSGSIVTLHTLTIPAFMFDDVGREVIIKAQGVFSGALGTKTMRVDLNVGGIFSAAGIASNNNGWYYEGWLLRTNHNTLKCSSRLYPTAGFGAPSVSQPYQETEYPNNFDFTQPISVLIRGAVANAGDAMEAHGTTIIRI